MDVLRPAGLNELRCIARDDLKLYGSIVTLGVYAGPRSLQLDDLIKILKHCIAAHPILGVCIQDADTERPQLVQAESLDLNAHIQMLESASDDDESTRCLLKTIHNDPLPDPRIRPQWRIVFQPINDPAAHCFRLGLACSHSLVDGRSGYAFHSTFLNSLERIDQLPEDSSPTWRPDGKTALLLSLESAGTLPISWGFLLGPLVQEYLPKYFGRWMGIESTSTENVWLGAPSRPPRTTSDPTTSVVVVSIPAKAVQNALDVCRGHDARLTGLLNHIVARCLCRALQQRQRSFSSFICETPIDLRRCLKQGEGQMANYVSAMTETVHVKRSDGPID